MGRFVATLSLGVVTTLLACTAALAEEQPKMSRMADAGRQEFNTYCVPCHGRSGIGDGVAASALKKPPADLTRIAFRRGGRFPRAGRILSRGPGRPGKRLTSGRPRA